MNRRLTLDRFLKDIANARYHTCLLKDELADARPHRLFPCSNPAEQVMPIGDKTAVSWLEMIGSRPWYINHHLACTSACSSGISAIQRHAERYKPDCGLKIIGSKSIKPIMRSLAMHTPKRRELTMHTNLRLFCWTLPFSFLLFLLFPRLLLPLNLHDLYFWHAGNRHILTTIPLEVYL